MGSRGTCVGLIAVALLPGCGGDDDGGDSATTGTTETRAAQSPMALDAQAKSDARELVTYVEACYADQQDYSACRDAARGEDVGRATVLSADAATFTVASPSESGNEFRLDRTGAGALERTCTKPGDAGCPANGRW